MKNYRMMNQQLTITGEYKQKFVLTVSSGGFRDHGKKIELRYDIILLDEHRPFDERQEKCFFQTKPLLRQPVIYIYLQMLEIIQILSDITTDIYDVMMKLQTKIF